MGKLFCICMLMLCGTTIGLGQQITLVGGCAAATTSCTPTVKGGGVFAAGQFEYVFAYKSSTTAPTLQSGFIGIDTASASSSSFRSACQVTSSSSPTSGTWTGATQLIVLIYSGVAGTTTANCKNLGIGGHTTAGTSGTTSTLTYTTITLSNSTGTSWVIGAAGSSAAVCTPATVFTSQYTSTDGVGNDTNGGVTSFSTLTCTGSTGNWKTDTVELLARTPTIVSQGGVNIGGLRGQIASIGGVRIGNETGWVKNINGYPVPLFGQTFNETWNQTITPQETCFSTTDCVNLWHLIQGTAPTITTASTCGATPSVGGFTNAIEMTSAATNPQIQTYGTMPWVPSYTSSASFDFYWWMCWDSATEEGSGTLVTLEDSSGDQLFFFGPTGTNGSFYANGTSFATGSTNGLWHLYHVNYSAGTTCEIQADGGAFTTFPCFNQGNFNFISAILEGETGDANFYFGPVYITAPNYIIGSWPVSAFSDWAGMSGTPTATSLAAGTHCGNSSNGSSSGWSQTANTGITFATSTGSTTFTNPLNACGTQYTGNTNISLEMEVSTTAGSGSAWENNYWTVYPAASIGQEFWFTGGPTQNTVGLDFFGIVDADGTVNNVQLLGVSGSNQLNFENDALGTSNAIAVNLVAGTHYWMSFGVSSTGLDTLYLYNQSTGSLLGSIVAKTKTTSVSSFTGTSGTLTFTTATQSPAYVAGQGIALSGFTGGNTGLNGQTVTVLSAGLSSTTFEAAVTGSGYSSGAGTAAQSDRPFVSPGALIIAYGKTGNETINTATNVFYGNSIIEYADAVVPIPPQ
jgi:hypothetical protein